MDHGFVDMAFLSRLDYVTCWLMPSYHRFISQYFRWLSIVSYILHAQNEEKKKILFLLCSSFLPTGGRSIAYRHRHTKSTGERVIYHLCFACTVEFITCVSLTHAQKLPCHFLLLLLISLHFLSFTKYSAYSSCMSIL